jgi:hypothetical protein
VALETGKRVLRLWGLPYLGETPALIFGNGLKFVTFEVSIFEDVSAPIENGETIFAEQDSGSSGGSVSHMSLKCLP